ncbi:MAG: DUF1330 domain-containing protein [Pseudomonadales bacterium]|nr:DUF1330 domain-containing protein [Pseudomonadales bacterium]
MPTQPRPDQIKALMEKAPEGELYMLNLLKFKEKAEYADGRKTDLSGAEAYGLYGQAVGEIIERMGGRAVFSGIPNVMVIGDGEPEWDAVAIIAYPNIEAFRNMTASQEYQEAHVHREAGLAHQLLINCLSQEQVGAILGG